MVLARRGRAQAALTSCVPHSVPQHRALVFGLMLKESLLMKQGWGRRVPWALSPGSLSC